MGLWLLERKPLLPLRSTCTKSYKRNPAPICWSLTVPTLKTLSIIDIKIIPMFPSKNPDVLFHYLFNSAALPYLLRYALNTTKHPTSMHFHSIFTTSMLIQTHRDKLSPTNIYDELINMQIRLHQHTSTILHLKTKEIIMSHLNYNRRSPSGVVDNVLDCNIVVDKFVLQSRYYVHFRVNNLRKGMNFLIPTLAMYHIRICETYIECS